MEPRAGGRIYETATKARTSEWGIVTAWVPGERVAFTWYPGMGPDEATAVDVTFAELPDGSGTRVDLVHTGWEARGADAAKMLAGYSTGWVYVLGQYEADARA